MIHSKKLYCDTVYVNLCVCAHMRVHMYLKQNYYETMLALSKVF